MDEFTSAEKALAAVHDVVETIGDDDFHRPTPCRDWDVQALADHLVATIARLGIAADIPTAVPDADSVDQRIQELTQPILAEWRRRGLAGEIVLAGEHCPRSSRLASCPSNSWSTAGISPQPYIVASTSPTPSPLTSSLWRSRPSRHRAAPTAGFDPPVPVPANACALDQLIAFTGRNPRGRFIDVDRVQLYAETRSGTAPALVSCATGEVHGGPGTRCSPACTPITLSWPTTSEVGATLRTRPDRTTWNASPTMHSR